MRIKTLTLGLAIGFALTQKAQASFGAEIPFLIEIIANTLSSLKELKGQSDMLKRELRGIDDKIERLNAIKELVTPKDVDAWKDPHEAARRLRRIYQTLPPEFRTEKSDAIERQISEAMRVAGVLTHTAQPAFDSGKQLEKEALEVGPAVSNKMAASGIGTLITLQSQSQVAQAQIIALLSQMIAESGSKEVSRLKSQAREYKTIGAGLSGFPQQIKLMEVKR